MKSHRRNFMLASAMAGLSLAGYSYHRGVRLPTLHWGPPTLKNRHSLIDIGTAFGVNVIQTGTRPGQQASFRAFAPEPELRVVFERSGSYSISVNNIADDAVLNSGETQPSLAESVDGITRLIKINARAGDQLTLAWRLPSLGRYQFASIGDTGGDQELAWCIQRAHALGARFLLHLGDFNYQPGDYQRSIDHFNASPIPIYVSIGNHDFHERGAIYGSFLKEIGPKNHAFSIGKTRFVNFDTAANIIPYGAGQRGKLFEDLSSQTGFTDTVAFTHRPLHDPLPDSDHDIGSHGERDWIIRSLNAIGAKTLLSGHIHIYDRRDFMGIDNIIVGQGLGHQDLIVNRDYSKMAIGRVDVDGRVIYEMAPLAMPMEMHCHPRTDPVKQSLRDAPHSDRINAIETACRAGREKA